MRYLPLWALLFGMSILSGSLQGYRGLAGLATIRWLKRVITDRLVRGG